MLSWIINLFFRRKQEIINLDFDEELFDEKEEKEESTFLDLASVFSTHVVKSKQELQLAIDNQVQALSSNFKEVLTVDGTGMDFGGSIDSVSTAKNAFVFGQQRLPENLFSWFVSHGFIGYQACGIIAQQWLINKACSIKGDDASRNGYYLSVDDGNNVDIEIIKEIEQADKRYKILKNLRRASKFNNVFGIRHVLFVVNSSDPKYYEKPFNPDGIKPNSYKGISQIDPYWITPLLDSAAVAEPESINFYEPTYWVISGRKYHRSHFVILRGPEVSDILKPSYIYGGIPLTQRIMERVYAAERTANEAPILAMTKRLNVRKMDLAKVAAQPEKLQEALSLQAEIRDNHGFLAAGKDEEVTQLETALADLDVTIMTQYQLVAAETGVPATRLLETSPKGFNATGEYEAKNYQQDLESLQAHEFQPIVERHHVCLMKSEITPKHGIDFTVEAVWNPVDMPTSKELAEINKMNAETDTAILNTGAVDNYEIRDKLIADKNSGYSGIEKIDRPDGGEPDLDITPSSEPDPEEGEITDEPGLAPLKEDPAARSAAANAIKDADGQDSIGIDVVRKEGKQWFVFGESGKKLGGPYSNRKKANNRLREIEHFKDEG